MNPVDPRTTKSTLNPAPVFYSSSVAGLRRRRPTKVVRFGKAALEAAIAVAAAGDENPVDVWIAFDSFINKRNRELRLAGTTPMRVPSLPRFLKLVDHRTSVAFKPDNNAPLKVIVAPKPITSAELASLARAKVTAAYADTPDGQSAVPPASPRPER